MVSVLGLASKVMFVRLALESKLVLSHANEPPLMCTWPGATTGLGLASSSSSSFCRAGQGCVMCEASVMCAGDGLGGGWARSLAHPSRAYRIWCCARQGGM